MWDEGGTECAGGAADSFSRRPDNLITKVNSLAYTARMRIAAVQVRGRGIGKSTNLRFQSLNIHAL
jgi:hypothetical protein